MCCGFNPRGDGARILAASLTVVPAPAERHDAMDRFGNRVTHVSFAGFSDLLRIESCFDLETIAVAPLCDPGLPSLPWSSGPHDGLAEDPALTEGRTQRFRRSR